MKRRLIAIFALDVVGYSRLMGVDEAGTLTRLKALHKEIVQPNIRQGKGRVIKVMGDGLLAEFVSVVEAVQCALSIQQAMADWEPERPVDQRIQLRIGVNLGDVIVEGLDIFGDGVNVAARLEQLSPPGGVCVSGGVHDQVLGKIHESFQDRGEQSVKNISHPVRVWSWTQDFDGDTSKEMVANSNIPTFSKASLAVLPFINHSSDPELDYVADALTEDVTTLMARLPGFLVIARNSSFAYKGSSPDIRQVGRDLEVAYVVEGSLRPVGEAIRVAVKLIQTENGNQLWANRFDQPAEKINELQDNITIGIASRIEPELARAEVARLKRRGEQNSDAWAYYTQASGLLSLKGWHRETFTEATGLLKKALERDPEFALAHAYLSLIYALGHMFGLSDHREDAKSSAVSAAEQAIEIDNHDAAVLGFAGCALSDVGLTGRGIETLERAIEADPSNAQAWVALGSSYLRKGKATKGIEMLRHGMRISPLDNRLSFWGTNLAYALLRTRQLPEAEAEALLACRRDNKNYMGKIVLALIFLQQKKPGPAKEAVEAALSLRPELTCQDVQALIGRRGVKLLQDARLLP